MQLDTETKDKKKGEGITLPICNAGESNDVKIIASNKTFR